MVHIFFLYGKKRDPKNTLVGVKKPAEEHSNTIPEVHVPDFHKHLPPEIRLFIQKLLYIPTRSLKIRFARKFIQKP